MTVFLVCFIRFCCFFAWCAPMMAADLSQCGDEGAPWLAVAGRDGVPKKRARRKAEGGGENGQRRAGSRANGRSVCAHTNGKGVPWAEHPRRGVPRGAGIPSPWAEHQPRRCAQGCALGCAQGCPPRVGCVAARTMQRAALRLHCGCTAASRSRRASTWGGREVVNQILPLIGRPKCHFLPAELRGGARAGHKEGRDDDAPSRQAHPSCLHF